MADHIDNACHQLSETARIMPVAPQSVQYTHQEIVANSEQGVTQVCHLPNHKGVANTGSTSHCQSCE